MDVELWNRVKAAFEELEPLETDARAARLNEICNGDHDLRVEVNKLLRANEQLDDFIENPAFKVADALGTSAERAAGKPIGHYKILREIGRGGMGTVFLADRDDDEFTHRVAIKVVSSGFVGSESLRRFRYERQILAGLDHPNIARLFDGGVTDGLPYLVMEYVDGVPLIDHADRHEMSIPDRLRLFLKVCHAVSYAHGNLVVHRDIKPSNILVTAEGEPKLLDFGLAKFTDAGDGIANTVTSFHALTPAYASPEQLRGEPLSTASDIYSLGVVLYELLTRKRPYDESLSVENMVRIVSGSTPERPSSRVKRSADEMPTSGSLPSPERTSRLLKGDVDNIVLMAMRHRPERRYRSVDQLAEDIERHLDGRPIVAAEDTFAYRASKFINRHRIGVALACLVILVLIGGIVATAWQASIARQQRDTAQAERAKAERINKFLQEMLSYSNQSWTSASSKGQKSSVTINEMLDDVGPRVRTEFADQPDMQARIFHTLGAAYNSQGRYETAEEYLTEALTISRQNNGAAGVETLDILVSLGETMFQTGKVDEGERLYRDLTILVRQTDTTLPDGKYRLAGALHGLGSVQTLRGDFVAAIPIMREAASTAEGAALTGNQRGLLAEIKLNLGAALLGIGELDEAENHLRDSLAIFQQLPGDPRWEVGVTLTRLGDCLVRKGRYSEGEPLLIRGAEIYRDAFGPTSHYLARNFNIRALAALTQGDFHRAETLSRESLDALKGVFPVPETVRARALFTLGTALCKTNRPTEAAPLLRESLTLFLPHNAPEIHDVTTTLETCSR